VATFITSAQRRETLFPLHHAAAAGWRREKNHIPPIIGVAESPRKAQRTPNTAMGRVFSSDLITPELLRQCRAAAAAT
jgi:hypothetical protein